MNLSLDDAGGPGSQPVTLAAAAHQVPVLEGMAAAEEVLRDRVPEATARPPRDDLVMLRFMT